MAELIIYFGIFGALCWGTLVLMPWRPWSVREKIDMGLAEQNDAFSSQVTVLIPARNEGSYIKRTLDGVIKQSADLKIIVVDDQSTDDTAKQARNGGTEVISGKKPPAGWSGKLWALEQGLKQIETPYVLLLDADIELAPGIIAHLHHKAEQEDLALVSLMAQLQMHHFVERMLMPAFIFFFKLLYPFGLSNKERTRVAAAAGGCILVRTQALRTVGAFSSLHDALIDDCALAAKIKRAGLRTWIGLSHAARSHRSYATLKPIWNMVARTAFTQLKYSKLMLVLCSLIMASMFWVAPLAFYFLSSLEAYLISGLTWLAMFVTYMPTLIYYQRSPLWVLALPLIGTLYLAMTWASALRYWRGERARWKGRRYENKTNN